LSLAGGQKHFRFSLPRFDSWNEGGKTKILQISLEQPYKSLLTWSSGHDDSIRQMDDFGVLMKLFCSAVYSNQYNTNVIINLKKPQIMSQ